jgi:hypothetical protein
MEAGMYATQIALSPEIDFVLVRIREPKTARAIEAANAAQIDPEIALERIQSGQGPGTADAGLGWRAEHALFVVTLTAIGCLEALALLA